MSMEQVERALRRIDDDLRLFRDVDRQYGCFSYRVMKFVSRDREAVQICGWRDPDGRPRELTHGIIDAVKKLRAIHIDPLVENDKLHDQTERQMHEAAVDAHKWGARVSSPGHSAGFHRSPALRMARDKRRAQGENV